MTTSTPTSDDKPIKFLRYTIQLVNGDQIYFYTKCSIKWWMDNEWKNKDFYAMPFMDVHDKEHMGRHCLVYINKNQIAQIYAMKEQEYRESELRKGPFNFDNYINLESRYKGIISDDIINLPYDVAHPNFAFCL